MKNNKHFIATTDKTTAETLRKLGFQELSKDGNRWMFINDPDNMLFSDDKLNVAYTDILTF